MFLLIIFHHQKNFPSAPSSVYLAHLSTINVSACCVDGARTALAICFCGKERISRFFFWLFLIFLSKRQVFFMIIFFSRPSTHFSLSRNNFFLIDLKTVHWAICERFLTNRLAICRLQLFAAINYKLNFPIRQERMTHVEVEISIFLRLSNGTSNKSVDRHLTLELFNCDLKSISLPNSPLQSIIGQWFACSRLIKLDSSIRSRKIAKILLQLRGITSVNYQNERETEVEKNIMKMFVSTIATRRVKRHKKSRKKNFKIVSLLVSHTKLSRHESNHFFFFFSLDSASPKRLRTHAETTPSSQTPTMMMREYGAAVIGRIASAFDWTTFSGAKSGKRWKSERREI